MGTPRPLLDLPGGTVGFEVESDGQRFLVNVPGVERSAVPLNLVLNWTSGLKKEMTLAVGFRLGPFDPLQGNPRFQKLVAGPK